MRKKADENLLETGQRIQKARLVSGMTQEQLAEAIDVTPQYLSDLERGIVGTSVSTLKKICIKLSVTSDYLLFGTGQNAEPSGTIEKLRYLPKEKADLIEQGVKLLLEAMDMEPDRR